MQGIFFYQQTHMEELQLEKTKNAIRQVFIDTGITPFQDARWKEYRRQRVTNHRRSSAANQVLSNILKLQDKKCISAYLFSLGLDDQDPAQWGDDELSELVVPEADCVSDSEECVAPLLATCIWFRKRTTATLGATWILGTSTEHKERKKRGIFASGT